MGARGILTLLAAATIVFVGEANSRDQADREVKDRLDQLVEAQLKNDGPKLEQIYAEDYTLTEPDGTMFTKRERIAAIGDLHFASSEITDVRIRVYDEHTAIVNFRAAVRFRGFKPDTTFRGQVTSVFVKINGEWILVASHESELE